MFKKRERKKEKKSKTEKRKEKSLANVGTLFIQQPLIMLYSKAISPLSENCSNGRLARRCLARGTSMAC